MHLQAKLLRAIQNRSIVRVGCNVAKPIRKALDLRELMDSVIGLNSEFAASCGATCKYRPEEEDLMIYADEGQISQILINLIKNAQQTVFELRFR